MKEAETEGCVCKPRTAGSPHNLEEARRTFLQILQREHGPVAPRPQASGLQNLKRINFCCSSPPVCASLLLRGPQDTKTDPKAPPHP